MKYFATTIAIWGTLFLAPGRTLQAKPPTFRKPPPPGVTEVIGYVGRGWSLAELKDGSLLAVGGSIYRKSMDDGVTWTDSKSLPGKQKGLSILRLQNNELVLYNETEMRISSDEGKSWSPASPIRLSGSPYYATMIQLRSGRLLYPNRLVFSNASHPELPREKVDTYGLWRGIRRQLSGHYHYPEIDIALVSHSEDSGKNWHSSKGYLMGWFDAQGIPNGYGGVTACDEPCVAETKDGRVLFFGRSTVGRIVQSYSRDDGVTWSAVRPTELASSYSPPRIVRIPKTGDLLCVWNQVSREEIRRGYRRGRLSAAISEDSGSSWKNFSTLEVSAGMQDIDRIPSESPIIPVIGLHDVGAIPDDFAVFRYANVSFAKDKVYIMYAREWFEADTESGTFEDGSGAGKIKSGREQVLRIYPLEYFYRS